MYLWKPARQNCVYLQTYHELKLLKWGLNHGRSLFILTHSLSMQITQPASWGLNEWSQRTWMQTDKIFIHAGHAIGACGISLAFFILEVPAH